MPAARFPYQTCATCRDAAGGDVPAIEIDDLCVAYSDGPELDAVRGLRLRVPAGTHVAVVGPNGSGKSTLLKAIAGAIPAHHGTILVHGQPVAACLHRISYLAQRSEIDWRFPVDVTGLVKTGRYVHLGWFARPGRDDDRRVHAALDRVGMAALARRQIGQLSGGQQQRALLARALVQDADVFLLDEPLNAVDGETRERVGEVLRDLRRAGKTVLIATHDVGRLEGDYDAALFLSDGRVVPAPHEAFGGAEAAMVTAAAG